MKVHFTKSVENRIRDVCREADETGKEIEFISLTRHEWDKLMVSKYVFTTEATVRGGAREYSIFGVPLKRDTPRGLSM
jgi:hypothetical protein